MASYKKSRYRVVLWIVGVSTFAFTITAALSPSGFLCGFGSESRDGSCGKLLPVQLVLFGVAILGTCIFSAERTKRDSAGKKIKTGPDLDAEAPDESQPENAPPPFNSETQLRWTGRKTQ